MENIFYLLNLELIWKRYLNLNYRDHSGIFRKFQKFQGPIWNFEKLQLITGTWLQKLIFRKGLGTFSTRGQLPCATDQWGPGTGGTTWRAWVLAWLPVPLTGGPAWVLTCKTGKRPCAGEGSNPRRVGARPWSLTTGPARVCCLDLARVEEEVNAERFLNLKQSSDFLNWRRGTAVLPCD